MILGKVITCAGKKTHQYTYAMNHHTSYDYKSTLLPTILFHYHYLDKR